MIGYRVWVPILKENELLLESVTNNYVWNRNTVSTDPPTSDLTEEDIDNLAGMGVHMPHWGFFSYKDLDYLLEDDDAENSYGFIIGAVKNFGKVVTHEYGYRAEHCQIIGLSSFMLCEGSQESDHLADRFLFSSNFFYGAYCKDHKLQAEGLDERPMHIVLGQLANRYECDVFTYHQMKGLIK